MLICDRTGQLRFIRTTLLLRSTYGSGERLWGFNGTFLTATGGSDYKIGGRFKVRSDPAQKPEKREEVPENFDKVS